MVEATTPGLSKEVKPKLEIEHMDEANPNLRLDVPVVLFIFRRPEETARVFAEIRKARPSRLFLIADGARESVEGETIAVSQTRRQVENVDWPCNVSRLYSETNLGLRAAILSGLDQVFDDCESAIVLEDDCVPSQSFFSFSEAMLTCYEQEPQVGLVSGFNFAPYRATADFHFSKAPYIWGWATWRRVWLKFRAAEEAESWSDHEIEEIRRDFASSDQARNFIQMMNEAKRLNTWDVSLAVWLRQNHLLSIVPRTNLIENIGFGALATHTKFEAFDVQVPVGEMQAPFEKPLKVEADSRRERRMWRTKRSRWLTFPLLHPITFTKSVLRYLRGV